VAGLNPRDYHFRNETEWLGTNAGIRIGKYGRLHTDPFLTASQAASLNRSGFTLEMVVSPSAVTKRSFGELITVHDGNDQTQFLIGQWRNSLIVMNGNDYSARRREPRLNADLPQSTNRHLPMHLLLATSPEGSRLYINGQRAVTRKGLGFNLPVGERSGRLTLGNSVRADSSWPGIIYALAFFPNAFTGELAQHHFQRWTQRTNLNHAAAASPLMLYQFEERRGQSVSNYGTAHVTLQIPVILESLERRLVTSMPVLRKWNQALVFDMSLNLFGFMPMGFVFMMLWYHSGRRWLPWLVLATVASAAVSFSIEGIQTWMPSRDSSLLDLILNTAGGFGGALCFVVNCHLRWKGFSDGKLASPGGIQ
jgi:VanZ family protein